MGTAIVILIMIVAAIIRRSYYKTPPKELPFIETPSDNNKKIRVGSAVRSKGQTSDFDMAVYSFDYNVIELAYCDEQSKLALLHYKEDSAYYITIINHLTKQVEKEFALDLTFLASTWSNVWLDDNAHHNYEPYKKYFGVNDGVLRKFMGLDQLKTFKVDFNHNQIMLFGRVLAYSILDSVKSVEEYSNDKYIFQVYNFDAQLQLQETFVNDDLYDVAYSNNKLLMVSDRGMKSLEVFFCETRETCFFDLLENEGVVGSKEFNYEYMEFLISLDGTNRFAFIAQNPTYGVQGVKIIEFLKPKEIKLIYDQDDFKFESSFKKLAFNYKLDEFVVLEYHQSDRFNLGVYATSNTEKPIKVIETRYRYSSNFIDMKYFSNDKLALVRSKEIIIYNLQNGMFETEIPRDNNSPYAITVSLIWYYFEGNLIAYA